MDLNKISGKAHYESHTWGRHSSIASKVIYSIILFLRFFSILQIIKYLHRNLKAKKAKDSSQKRLDRKDRLDFHALYSEIYLMSIMTISVLLYLLINQSILNHTILIKIISFYFFIESTIWIVYYMLFRILMEKKLSIHDEAEYLIMFPVVVIIQLFSLSILVPNTNPLIILGLLFNIGSVTYSQIQWIPILIGTLGVVYIAAIIASLINIIPKIPVWRRPNITVIGAGDVVMNKILPTLQKLYSNKQLAITADFISPETASQLNKNKIRYFSVYKSPPKELYSHEERTNILNKIISFVRMRSSYAIIATPSDEHFAYIMALANEKIKFAVEKPICSAQPHVQALLNSSNHLMNDGFLLSYYILEKSLPLKYFLTLNPAYRDLLEIQTLDNTLGSPSSFSRLRKELGKENLIVVEFLEGDETENRYWTEIPETGGMVTETFIHTLSLVRTIIDINQTITYSSQLWIRNADRKKLIKEKYKRIIGPTYVDIIAQSGSCNIRLRMGKYTSHKSRRMEIHYEYGRIICDFDDQCCLIYKSTDKTPCLKIKLKYIGKYETQLLLFHDFMQKGWKGFRFDDFPNQLHILNECLDLYPRDECIIDKGKDDLNIWLNNNLLFEEKNLTIKDTDINSRYEPDK